MFSLLRRLIPVFVLFPIIPLALTSQRGVIASPPAKGMQLAVALSDLTVGRNRFAFGLLDNNHPVNVSSAQLVLYSVHGATGKVEQIVTARFNDFAKGLKHDAANSAAEDIKGVYVAYPTFKHAGQWVAEARFSYRGTKQVAQQGFVVLSHSKVPQVGQSAPRSNNPTIKQMPVSKLDSGRPPDDMHTVSIAAAIAQHRPLVVLFSTPAFCTSRMCGPETDIVKGLENRFRGRATFIHIEVYKNANPQYGLAPTMLQWHLESEPWVFVINRRGTITARFEGPTSAAEMVPAIQGIIASR